MFEKIPKDSVLSTNYKLIDDQIRMMSKKTGLCKDCGCRIAWDLDNNPFAVLIPKKMPWDNGWIVEQMVIDDLQDNINNLSPQILYINPFILDWCNKLNIERNEYA